MLAAVLALVAALQAPGGSEGRPVWRALAPEGTAEGARSPASQAPVQRHEASAEVRRTIQASWALDDVPAITTQTSWAYAGHERVDGFQLSDFGRRSYHGRAVAFVTPDRDRLGDLDDPASFNRYAYARGNPETLVDPDGRTPVAAVLPAAPAAALSPIR